MRATTGHGQRGAMPSIDLPPNTAASADATSTAPTSTAPTPSGRTGSRYIGPPPLAPALAHTVLFVASILVGTSAGVFARPDTAAGTVTAHLADHVGAARLVALLQVASAVVLGVLTAAAAAAIRARTPRLAGLDIARFGGYGAALLLATNALAAWSAASLASGGTTGGTDGGTGVPAGDAATAAAVKALTLLSFATGGVGYVALFGLLLAGIAVPLYLGRLAPRWVGGTGIALAVLAELSLLSLVTDSLQPLLPVARFPGTLWLLGVAAVIARPGRGRVRPRRSPR